MTEVEPGLNIIYARSLNRCIGANGQVPWSLPDEYAFFERTSRGYPLIMGRRSYEDHDGLLPNSPNIIVSSQPDLCLEPEALLANSFVQALEIAASLNPRYFVIGGAGLIEASVKQATCVFESVVDAEISGDTYLDRFDFDDWTTTTLIQHPTDQSHAFSFAAYKHVRPRTS